MRTMRLLLGNSEQLLTNFIEVLVQDACGESGLVRTTRARTIEAVILEGLTGSYDLGILIPKNLLPDSASTRIYNPFSEVAQAVRVLKKRCSMPIVAAAAVDYHSVQAQILREAGVDALVGLPFNPKQFASAVRELIHHMGEAQTGKESNFSKWFQDGLSPVSRWEPARAMQEGTP